MAWSTLTWTIAIRTILAETILCLRTWAMWNNKKVVGIFLASAMLAFAILQCYLAETLNLSLQFAPSPYSWYKGCFLTNASRVVWAQMASLFLLELVVFILVVISAFRLYRTGRHTELSYVIHRDGILFYVYLLALTGVNLVLTLAAPMTFTTILVPFLDALHSVFTARIVLNIRMVAVHGQNTELHASGFGMGANDTSLQFISLGHGQDH